MFCMKLIRYCPIFVRLMSGDPMLPNRLTMDMTKDATVCIHCLYGHCMFHALIARLNFLMDTKNIII